MIHTRPSGVCVSPASSPYSNPDGGVGPAPVPGWTGDFSALAGG